MGSTGAMRLAGGTSYPPENKLLQAIIREPYRGPGETLNRFLSGKGFKLVSRVSDGSTPKGRLNRLERGLMGKPWQEVRPGVQVKLLPQDDEFYVFAQSLSGSPPRSAQCAGDN